MILLLKFTSNIKKKIKELDDTYYSNKVDLSWYNRYFDNSDIYLLVDKLGNIVGYLYGAFITEELYKDILNGKVKSDFDISPDSFVEESLYIYLASSLIDKSYRGLGYGKLLMESFLLDNNKKNIVVLATSLDGYRLLSKYLKVVLKIDSSRFIFSNC